MFFSHFPSFHMYTSDISGSRQGATIPARGRPTKSGDDFGCHTWRMLQSSAVRGQGRCCAPIYSRDSPQPERITWPQKSIVPRLRKPELMLIALNKKA